MKKTVLFLLTFILMLSAAPSVLAANVSEGEALILEKMNYSAAAGEITYTFPKRYVGQMENYLLAHDVSDSTAKGVVKDLDKIIKTAESEIENFKTYGEVFDLLSPKAKASVNKSVLSIAKRLGLSVSYDKDCTKLIDGEGCAWFSNEPIVKATGKAQNFAVPAIILFVAVIIFSGRKIFLEVTGR
jgi:hypothetical protein